MHDVELWGLQRPVQMSPRCQLASLVASLRPRGHFPGPPSVHSSPGPLLRGKGASSSRKRPPLFRFHQESWTHPKGSTPSDSTGFRRDRLLPAEIWAAVQLPSSFCGWRDCADPATPHIFSANLSIQPLLGTYRTPGEPHRPPRPRPASVPSSLLNCKEFIL